jgi:hypothetical protein
MASESTPPPPAAGGARYAIAGVALAAIALLGYCMIVPGSPPPSTTATPTGPVDSGVIERSTALVEDDLVIPADEPDTNTPDAGEVHEVTHRPTTPRGPSLGEWGSCTGELNARPVFEEYQSQFRACYEHRLKANPLLQGQMQLQVRVVADGHVEGVQVGGSLNDREVFSCVRNLANRMRFPHVTGGSCAVVAVPYTFTPQQ